MHDGTTLIVDVEQIDGQYVLSLPAEDLWVAYEVVRRHIDADGVRHYSQMTAASMTDDGYEFTFDTGDVFACASHLLRPASDTCSDASGGGGGGGVLVVTETDGTLDKTWQEIHDAAFATLVMFDETVYVLDSRYELNGTYVVCFYNSTGSDTREYHATSASRHPSAPNGEA